MLLLHEKPKSGHLRKDQEERKRVWVPPFVKGVDMREYLANCYRIAEVYGREPAQEMEFEKPRHELDAGRGLGQ